MIHRPRQPRVVLAILSFTLGVFTTALFVWQHGPFEMPQAAAAVGVNRVARPAAPEAPPAALGTSGTVTTRAADLAEELAERDLIVPVEGVNRDALINTFEADRDGGARKHQAIDILAPRDTPVLAADAGRIARLFKSAPGGLTIYQFDPSERFVYYYAHLERYADGLEQGDRVRRGQIIGYVGTSGNAPDNTPHLHFAIFRTTDEKRWWEGTPIDPYGILKKDR